MRCTDFSLPWLLLLQSTGTRSMGFSRCGTRAYLLHGMQDLLGPGKILVPNPLCWQMDSYPLDHQGSPGFAFYLARRDTNSKGQSSEADAPVPLLLPSAPEVPPAQGTSSVPHPPDISLGAPSSTWRFFFWGQASAHPSYMENSCSDPSPHSRAGTQVKCVPTEP